METKTAHKILDFDGNPLLKEDAKTLDDHITVGSILVKLLSIPEKLSSDEKMDRFKLSLRIHDQENTDLSVLELEKLKKIVESAYISPLIHGRMIEWFDTYLNKEV